MKIKVCGLTQYEQMANLQNRGFDYIGMIFYEGSKRYVGKHLESQKSAIRELEILKVGVFVNADSDTIGKAIADYSLSLVQLHGDESPENCLQLMTKIAVIKAFQIGDDTDIDALVAPYKDACNYYLLDKANESYGGSGAQFDWSKLDRAIINKPFFLSGGIGPEDAERLHSTNHPFLHGIDINSRFEMSPGIKDLNKIETFITRLKERHD